ncbi:putative motility protein [Lentibacillus lipolyticus]|nr:putative motility protein [Lentibacillus lipolyticus]
MDVAAASVVMANQQVRADASMAVMDKAKNTMEEQGKQLVTMLEQSHVPSPSHPTLGNMIDQSV